MEAKRWYSITRDKVGVVSGMSDRTKYSWPDKKGSLVLAHDHSVLRAERDGHCATDFICINRKVLGLVSKGLFEHSSQRPSTLRRGQFRGPEPRKQCCVPNHPELRLKTCILLRKLHLGQNSLGIAHLCPTWRQLATQRLVLESSEGSSRCLIIKELK